MYPDLASLMFNSDACSNCEFLFADTTGQHSPEKLEFKNRVSIALGAAKGDPLQNQ